jgi:catechol 2,3-dioxygenase-like lactoylglutathione lyase family enzyme
VRIASLDHIALLVKDVERARAFYCSVLGFDEVPGLGAIWLRNGNAEIHLLGESEEGRAIGITSNLYNAEELARGHVSHIAFSVPDLEEAQRHLSVHHIEIVCGPRPRGNNGEQLYICDPDGYVIELFAREPV